MALNIVRTTETKERFMKALITGQPGSGKSLMSGSSFPDPFFLTTEGLMMSLEAAGHDVPYVKITSLDDVLNAVDILRQAPSRIEDMLGFPVWTVVVDTIDDLADMIMRQRLKEQGRTATSRDDYGWLRKELMALTAAFRNLNMNVIFTCHLKDKEVGGISTYVPGIEGSFSDKIAEYFNIVGVIRVDEENEIVDGKLVKKSKRILQVHQDAQFQFLKDHSFKIPQDFEINFEDDYQRLSTLIWGEVPDLGNLGKQVEAEVEQREQALAEKKVEEETEFAEGLFLPDEFTKPGEAKNYLLSLVNSPDEAKALWESSGAKDWPTFPRADLDALVLNKDTTEVAAESVSQ